jgi:hypothetical protein
VYENDNVIVIKWRCLYICKRTVLSLCFEKNVSRDFAGLARQIFGEDLLPSHQSPGDEMPGHVLCSLALDAEHRPSFSLTYLSKYLMMGSNDGSNV